MGNGRIIGAPAKKLQAGGRRALAGWFGTYWLASKTPGAGKVEQAMPPRRVFHSPLAPGLTRLDDDEGHHVRDVLRGRLGDPLTAFDGEGGWAPATIVQISRREVVLELGEPVHGPYADALRLTLAVAMPRAHRQQFLIEKGTELGVWAFWPLVTDRSVTRSGDQQAGKWRRTAIEASKQCGRNWLPRFEAPQTMSAVLGRTAEFDRVVVADGDAVFPPLAEVILGASRALVLIGPEGGFAPAELEAARMAGAFRGRLGAYRLRTETAALAVAACLGFSGRHET